MSVIIFLKEKSSDHGNVENSVKFPKIVSIKTFTATFICGKSVENMWKTCGKLISDFHCRHSLMRFIFHFDLSPCLNISRGFRYPKNW
jgi:hypothetical protein